MHMTKVHIGCNVHPMCTRCARAHWVRCAPNVHPMCTCAKQSVLPVIVKAFPDCREICSRLICQHEVTQHVKHRSSEPLICSDVLRVHQVNHDRCYGHPRQIEERVSLWVCCSPFSICRPSGCFPSSSDPEVCPWPRAISYVGSALATWGARP